MELAPREPQIAAITLAAFKIYNLQQSPSAADSNIPRRPGRRRTLVALSRARLVVQRTLRPTTSQPSRLSFHTYRFSGDEKETGTVANARDQMLPCRRSVLILAAGRRPGRQNERPPCPDFFLSPPACRPGMCSRRRRWLPEAISIQRSGRSTRACWRRPLRRKFRNSHVAAGCPERHLPVRQPCGRISKSPSVSLIAFQSGKQLPGPTESVL